MSPQEFVNKWSYLDIPLSPISKDRLEKFNLLPHTAEFLMIAGLPVYTSANLCFTNDSDDLIEGINLLTEQYDFLEKGIGYEKYVVIGSCRDGDAIAINISENNQIEELDHEDSFNPIFFNSSINALADFLIIYEEFEKSVSEEFGEDGILNGNFTDIQFDKMRNEMYKADEKALTVEGFWKEELDILLSFRKNNFLSI
ncbi:SUKH-4 family immunity protein [Ferruginibacter sp.]